MVTPTRRTTSTRVCSIFLPRQRVTLRVMVIDNIALLAFDAGSKKFGYNVNRDTSEKITDGARGAFEKATG